MDRCNTILLFSSSYPLRIIYNFLVAYDIPANHAVKLRVYLLIYLPPFIHVDCLVLVGCLDVAIHIACACFLLIVVVVMFIVSFSSNLPLTTKYIKLGVDLVYKERGSLYTLI